MHRLALVAVLALALVPTVGRVAKAGAGVDHGAMQHATTAAQVVVDPHAAHRGHHGAHHAMAEAPPAAPAPMPHHGDGDCEYCPLLQGLVTPAPAAVAPLDAAPPAHVAQRNTPARIAFRHPNGLGSRGPPPIS